MHLVPIFQHLFMFFRLLRNFWTAEDQWLYVDYKI